MKYSERSPEWKRQARYNDMMLLRIVLRDAALCVFFVPIIIYKLAEKT